MDTVGVLTCADCGTEMRRHRTSAVQGKARCLPCRRARPTRPTRKYASTAGDTAACDRCGRQYVKQTSWQRLCKNPCTRDNGSHGAKTYSTSVRGYGSAHRRHRKEAVARWQDGDPCARCQQPMWHGTPVDLDHTDDRTGYLGLSHASCNRGGTRQTLRAIRRDAICDECGVPFRTRWEAQRLCSAVCAKVDRKRRGELARQQRDGKRERKAALHRPPFDARTCPNCRSTFCPTRSAERVYCSEACARLGQACAPCAECGGPVALGRSSRPAGEAVCHPCRPARRAAIDAGAVRSGQPWTADEIAVLSQDRVKVQALAAEWQRTLSSVKHKRKRVRGSA